MHGPVFYINPEFKTCGDGIWERKNKTCTKEDSGQGFTFKNAHVYGEVYKLKNNNGKPKHVYYFMNEVYWRSW